MTPEVTFIGFRSPLRHFVEEARRRGFIRQVRTIHRGETVPLTP
ncbi:hypothetical protein ABZV78_10955 [Micromonospora sp. NPDC004540]